MFFDDSLDGASSDDSVDTSKGPTVASHAKTTVTVSTGSSSSSYADRHNSSSSKKPYKDDLDSGASVSFSERWTQIVLHIHRPILNVLNAIARTAALHPVRTLVLCIVTSLVLLGTGIKTNFSLNVNEHELWTPQGSYPAQHYHWITDTVESGFVDSKLWVAMLFHNEGENVLSRDTLEHVFTAVDTARNLSTYDIACAEGALLERPEDCSVVGVTNFWNDNVTDFLLQVGDSNEQALIDVSASRTPNGIPVLDKLFFGYPERDNATNTLVGVQSLAVIMHVPNTNHSGDWELEAVSALKALQEQWAADPSMGIKFELHSKFSIGREVVRAISEDIILVPLIFVAMSLFTAMVFARGNALLSRGTLGIGAVAAVLLSLFSGFGLLFIIGVPLTSVTQISPFIMYVLEHANETQYLTSHFYSFGIGLDDAFILIGSYSRTDTKKDPVDRISDTIYDVGMSVTLTTVTSASAFGLGYLSSIPAIQWLCLYAFPTILFVFLYQLTFFVACIVIDERRIMARRKDPLLCCLPVSGSENEQTVDKENIVDRWMEAYARQLVRPWVRVFVVCAFGVLLGCCLLSASKFEQQFAITDVLPTDSYITEFTHATDLYRDAGPLPSKVYFRDVDHADPEVRQQMRSFLADLGESEYFEDKPELFWMDSFDVFVSFNPALRSLSFNEQMDAFLLNDLFYSLFHLDITRDAEGNVIASRTLMRMKVDLADVEDQVNALMEQRNITASQPINQGRERLAFFTFDGVYNMWEFFSLAVDELIFTTASCVVAVTLVTLLLMPHWTAAFFVLPLVMILYLDLLGVMQWAGLHINAVSFISLVMSVGILVDFLMHCLFRFYECKGNRVEKTVDMLRTMGSSILLGGVTTFLGIVPLMFSSSSLFETVFFCFLGIVTLGIGHGLILLPTLLATFGPEAQLHVSAYFVQTPPSSDAKPKEIPTLMNTEKISQAHDTVKYDTEHSSSIVYLRSQSGTFESDEIDV